MMKRRLAPLLGATLLGLALPPVVEAQRRPIEVAPIREVRLEAIEPGYRYDPVQHRMVPFDPEPRIEFLPETGDYRASWIGVDGAVKSFVQEPNNRVKVTVSCEVAFDEVTSLFTYTYMAFTLPSSPQDLQSIYLEAAGVQAASPSDRTWMSTRLTPFLQDLFGAREGWAWSHVPGDRPGIPPGQATPPLRLQSPHPPGIVRVWIAGQVGLPRVEEEEMPPDELVRALGRVARRYLPVGRTIGPVSPSDIPAASAQQLEWLEAQLEVAAEEGWLGVSQVAERARSSVTTARTALLRDERVRAAMELDAGVVVVAAAQEEDLLSEAKALLAFHLKRVREVIR